MDQPSQPSPYGYQPPPQPGSAQIPPISYGPQGYPPPGAMPSYPPGEVSGTWPPPQSGPRPQKSSGSKTLLMIIIAVVVIAGAFGGWYFFLRGAAALPSSWVASRSANGVGEAYYLHWETNGDNLKGGIEFAYISKSTTQSVTEPVTGTYNSQDHSVTLTYSGITSPIIKGTIINNNTLTLNSNDPHMTDAITFYAGDYNEYLHEINDLKGKLS